MQLIVLRDGSLRCLYGEELNLAALGRITIRRASHVEPTEDGRWTADLTVSGGPVLGPFALHSEALEAERAWLETRLAGTTLDAVARPGNSENS
jgi:hypothetical protein